MKRWFLLIFVFLAATLSIGVRLLPHPPNFTPVGALSLFIGVYLAKKYRWTFAIPLLVMFLSDLGIGFYDWKLMAVVYGSFLVYGLIGLLVSLKKNIASIFFGSLGGATFFYLATNFAVWAFYPWYPHNFQGLIRSFTLALPFFKYTLLGDIFFTLVLFCSYEFAKACLTSDVKQGSESLVWKLSSKHDLKKR